MAAIRRLHQQVQTLEAENAELKARVAALERRPGAAAALASGRRDWRQCWGC